MKGTGEPPNDVQANEKERSERSERTKRAAGEISNGQAVRLKALPVTLRRANDFVAEHHRHSGRTARNGGKFAIGVTAGGELLGVAIVGNPVSATLMDGLTVEVLRCCVVPDAPLGACSFLYGRCWRIWQQMGGVRMITYTLQDEGGASLRGVGWSLAGQVKPHRRWEAKGRRTQAIYGQPKYRWEVRAVDDAA